MKKRCMYLIRLRTHVNTFSSDYCYNHHGYYLRWEYKVYTHQIHHIFHNPRLTSGDITMMRI